VVLLIPPAAQYEEPAGFEASVTIPNKINMTTGRSIVIDQFVYSVVFVINVVNCLIDN
jgi:hypothetical protein